MQTVAQYIFIIKYYRLLLLLMLLLLLLLFSTIHLIGLGPFPTLTHHQLPNFNFCLLYQTTIIRIVATIFSYS